MAWEASSHRSEPVQQWALPALPPDEQDKRPKSLQTPLAWPCIGPPKLKVCCVFFGPLLKCLSLAAWRLFHHRPVSGFANLSLSSLSPNFMEGNYRLTQKDIFILMRKDWVQWPTVIRVSGSPSLSPGGITAFNVAWEEWTYPALAFLLLHR